MFSDGMLVPPGGGGLKFTAGIPADKDELYFLLVM